MRYKEIDQDDSSPRFGVFLNWGNGNQVLSNPLKSLQSAVLVKSTIVKDDVKVVPFILQDYQQPQVKNCI